MTTAGGAPSPTRFSDGLKSLDRATQFIEKPVQRASGAARLNPIVHAGTISVFLLAVVIVTGLYITLFFQFGFAASYDSVAAMENHLIQRPMRAIHRYASAALVVTTLIHAWKIFTSRRFEGPRRRWRWASGVAALTLVWLAGVTGYWLVWDRRAAAISEAVAKLLQPTGAGSRFAVRNLLGVSPGSGSGLLLVIWLLHLGLTAVIGWFMFRHLRRSRQPWLPPYRWMLAMGGSLALIALVLPVGMLDPARPDQLVANMPLDPFVLFLLPPLLSSWRWVAFWIMILAPAVFIFVPRLLRRADPAVVQIDENACTGCEICVVDCPYDALSMHTTAERSVAVLEADQCVACGICVGSCAFDAIDLPGLAAAPISSVEGKDVVVMCDRHDVADAQADDSVVVPVRCAGMFAPNATRGYIERGANNVHLIGCSPGDCRYGTGNLLAAERLAGDRAPHPPRKVADRVATDFVSSDQVRWSRSHQAETSIQEPDDPRRYVGAAMVVLVSIAAIVAATSAPFRSTSQARVRVVVDHVANNLLAGYDLAPGVIDGVQVVVDGETLEYKSLPQDGSATVGFADWPVSTGAHDIEILAFVDDIPVSLDVAAVELGDREQFTLAATDVPEAPGSRAGRDVFQSRAAGCTVCHATEAGRDGVGPTLYGVADVAGERVEGLDAELYLRQSILLPDQYIVEGWPAGQMLPIYRERLDEQQLESLLTYLLTLTQDGGS